MAKFTVDGLNEFSDYLNEFADSVSDLNGKEISAEELFDESGFVAIHTKFQTISEFLNGFGLELSDDEICCDDSESPFNLYVSNMTDGGFSTFNEFHSAATDSFIDSLLP